MLTLTLSQTCVKRSLSQASPTRIQSRKGYTSRSKLLKRLPHDNIVVHLRTELLLLVHMFCAIRGYRINKGFCRALWRTAFPWLLYRQLRGQVREWLSSSRQRTYHLLHDKYGHIWRGLSTPNNRLKAFRWWNKLIKLLYLFESVHRYVFNWRWFWGLILESLPLGKSNVCSFTQYVEIRV